MVPDVAVTITVKVFGAVEGDGVGAGAGAAGVLDCEAILAPPVPHPASSNSTSIEAPSNSASLPCFFIFLIFAAESVPKSPKTAVDNCNPSAGTPPGWPDLPGIAGISSEAEVVEVVIVSEVLADEPPGASGLLLKLQLAPDGSPEQLKAMGAANEPLGVSMSE